MKSHPKFLSYICGVSALLSLGRPALAADATETPPPAQAAAAPQAAPAAQSDAAAAAAEQQKLVPVVVTHDGEKFTLRSQDATVGQILDALKAESGVGIDVDESILGNKMTLNMEGVTLEKILEILAGSHALIYERTANGGYRLTQARLTGRQEYIAPKLSDLSRKDKRNVKDLTAEVKKLLEAHGKIIQDVGELDYEHAKALIADRNKQMQEIVDQLAKLGPGGARAMLDATGTDTAVNELIAMIKALAMIDDPEASAILGKMYGNFDKYSLQREVVGSLGQRKDATSEEVLRSVLKSTEDERMRAGVVQALSGRPTALEDLVTIVNSAAETPDVRAEAIRSLGLIGNDAARDSLAKIAVSGTYSQILRKSAIQELGRSYGDASVPTLQSLLGDRDDAVRESAVRALSRMDSPESTTILRAVSTGDVSSVIRAYAESALSARNTTPAAPAAPNSHD